MYWLVMLVWKGLKKIYHYSGFKYIVSKFIPKEDKLPTGPIWVLSIYLTAYGISSQRYENRVDIIENKISVLNTQIAGECKIVGSEISEIQNFPCPIKPTLFDFKSIFFSLFPYLTIITSNEEKVNDSSYKYEGTIDLLRKTVSKWKHKGGFADLSSSELRNLNLHGADFSMADLSRADLSGVNLSQANLRGANLEWANLTGANLDGADLTGAKLGRSDLTGANLIGANLSGAYLRGTTFDEAMLTYTVLKSTRNLSVKQLSKTNNLYRAKFDIDLEQQLRRKYPELFNAPEMTIRWDQGKVQFQR